MLSHWYKHDNVGNLLKAKNSTLINHKMDSQNFLKVPNVSLNHEAFLFSPSRKVSSTSLGATSSSISSIRDGSLSYRVPWKFVILGDAGVGKSSLVKQFLDFGFSSVYNPTVEDNYIHNINLPDGTTNCVEILDTSGFYQFPAMKELNIRLGTAFILVFDLTCSRTLKNLVDLRQIIVNLKQSEDVPIVLVGNKSDLVNPSDITVLEQEFLSVIESFKCVYIETSAKNNTNVSDIFKIIIELIVRDVEDGSSSANRRNSSISFVRRLSISASRKKQTEQSLRRFSEPAVVKNPSQQKNKNKQNSAKESGKTTPLFRRKQKNCSIS